MKKNRIISTLTNIAYGVAGVALYLTSTSLLFPSIYMVLLMFGSGYHHYHRRVWSRKWDFMGMYAALFSTASFGLTGASVLTCVGPLVLAPVLYLLFGNSRRVIGVLIIYLLAVVWITAHPVYAIALASFAALAFTFNMLGDTLQRQYDPVHGVGWHIPTAGALMAANLILLFARLQTLPLI